MRLWLSGVLVFCLAAQGTICTGYGPDSPITRQIESLKDDDRHVRAEAINSLVKLGTVVVLPLINVLKSENVNLRREAVAVFGRLKDARAVDPLPFSAIGQPAH